MGPRLVEVHRRRHDLAQAAGKELLVDDAHALRRHEDRKQRAEQHQAPHGPATMHCAEIDQAGPDQLARRHGERAGDGGEPERGFSEQYRFAGIAPLGERPVHHQDRANDDELGNESAGQRFPVDGDASPLLRLIPNRFAVVGRLRRSQRNHLESLISLQRFHKSIPVLDFPTA